MIEFNGRTYARVTEVLSPFSSFGHIKKDVLANKCRIGTEVHQAIEDDINGAFPCLASDCRPYYLSFEKWRNSLKPVFLASETRYYCDEKMITGKIDTLIKMPGDAQLPILVDFKTSAQESKETWPMQAHLYAYLLAKNGVLVSPRFLFVKLDKFGSYPKVFEYLWSLNIQNKCMNAVTDFWSSQSNI